MHAKVTTTVCTYKQKQELQQLGCEEKPYLMFADSLIFRATIDDNTQLDALRALPFVLSVAPMPIYHLMEGK